MLTKNKNSFILYTGGLLVGLLLLNLIARDIFDRYDLTDNKMYSLSSSSKSIVSKVDELLTMKVYFSDDLPNELGNTRRFLQDILEEFSAYSDNNIRFFFSIEWMFKHHSQWKNRTNGICNIFSSSLRIGTMNWFI